MSVLNALKVLYECYKIVVLIGVELEFYFVRDSMQCGSNDLLAKQYLMSNIKKDFKFIQEIKKEVGINQYEMVTVPSFEAHMLISSVVEFKKYLHDEATACDAYVTFEAKPYIDLPGSAMHINLTFYEFVDNKLIDAEHHLFPYILAGMCNCMRSSMLSFAPNVESYRRFHYADIYTPSFINWGFNNRSVAIRVVSSKCKNFRIEHRVSGADADVESVINHILVSAIMGIKNKLKNTLSEFGIMDYNKGYEQRLPVTLTEARRCFKELKLDFV